MALNISESFARNGEPRSGPRNFVKPVKLLTVIARTAGSSAMPMMRCYGSLARQGILPSITPRNSVQTAIVCKCQEPIADLPEERWRKHPVDKLAGLLA